MACCCRSQNSQLLTPVINFNRHLSGIYKFLPRVMLANDVPDISSDIAHSIIYFDLRLNYYIRMSINHKIDRLQSD